MCGIAGCFSARDGSTPRGRDVFRMTQALAHRGPDDEGLLFWRRGEAAVCAATDQTVAPLRALLPDATPCFNLAWNLVLGHRRFSILDVTPGGHQPFVDPEGRAAVVFNGEIYNFIELHAELEKIGVVFRTRSDTEVLLNAYLEWGDAMLPRLNGMWAFALVDFRSGRLLLSRDRVGEKPLFFTRRDDQLFFASEIKALFQVDELWARREADDARVLDFLYSGLRDHHPGSFFKGIEQLPPGSMAWVDEHGGMEVRPYWNLPRERWSARDISFDEAADGFTRRLKTSVALRLRSDVPLASELSGGMDSTSMVALAADHLRETSAPPLQTVTIRYPDRAFDESPLAEAAAKSCGVPWTSICLEGQEYWEAADEMALLQEQPYESPNQLGSRALWRWMKDRGIRVVLNGGAGDELLAGYIGHLLAPFFAELFSRGDWRTCWREARHWWGGRYLNGVILRRHLLRHLPGAAGRWYMERMFSLPHFDAILRPPPAGFAGVVAHARAGSHFYLRDSLLSFIEFAPMPMYMVHGDKLSMSVPVEIRFPFLDPQLMDYAFRLPVEHFFRGGESKAILRESMRKRLPGEIINRREKMGFPVPLERWMREGRSRIEANLKRDGRAARFVNIEYFCRNFDRVDASLIWRIHQVESWMRLYDLR